MMTGILKSINFDMSKINGKLPELLKKLSKPSEKKEKPPEKEAGGPDMSSSLARILTGGSTVVGEYYFPSELIGGCCPRVVGQEEDIVWNAAAEACDTERVHVIWHSVGDKIWYLAVRSSELSSHANTWCPFASLLPGMKDAAPPPTCYTYYTDEAATMMTITQDGLQIHRGMSSVVRAKAERSARELGNIPVIELVPDRFMKLTPVPWYSLSLFEDRARRILAAISVVSAIGFAALAFLIWSFAAMSSIAAKANLEEAQKSSESKTLQLMRMVQNMHTSPIQEDLAKFADVNDGLLNLGGFLEVYEIKDGTTRWRAIVPPNVTADRISQLGGQTIETVTQGVAIGNAAEIAYEAEKRK